MARLKHAMMKEKDVNQLMAHLSLILKVSMNGITDPSIKLCNKCRRTSLSLLVGVLSVDSLIDMLLSYR